MKRGLIITLLLSLASASSFAGQDCSSVAMDLAKMNLESKAINASGTTSDLDSNITSKVDNKDGTSIFTIGGAIYRAEYIVTVTVDASCGVESVKIEEAK